MTIQLDHNELISAVQVAMCAQLLRDGRYRNGMELALTFSSTDPADMQVVGTVRLNGRVVDSLKGGRSQLCAIATSLALRKLRDHRLYLPTAQVRWRCVQFTDEEGAVDRFMVDVEFRRREVG